MMHHGRLEREEKNRVGATIIATFLNNIFNQLVQK